MEVLVASLCFGMLFFSMESRGQEQELTQFFTEHKAEIQDYIMAGHGRDWLDCDVLSLSPLTIGDAPQFMMDFETFDKLDLRSTLSSSHCLLAAYHVESKELREYTSEMKRSAFQYRAEKKSWQILLSRTQAGPDRKVKQEQEEISRNHVPRLLLGSVCTGAFGQLSPVEFGRFGWAPWAILLNSQGYGYRVAISS